MRAKPKKPPLHTVPLQLPLPLLLLSLPLRHYVAMPLCHYAAALLRRCATADAASAACPLSREGPPLRRCRCTAARCATAAAAAVATAATATASLCCWLLRQCAATDAATAACPPSCEGKAQATRGRPCTAAAAPLPAVHCSCRCHCCCCHCRCAAMPLATELMRQCAAVDAATAAPMR